MMSSYYNHNSQGDKKRPRGNSTSADDHHHDNTDNDNDEHLADATMSTATATTPSQPQPFVNLPMYGEHKRAVSSVKLAPSRLTQNRSGSPGILSAICASASSDGTVKIWDLNAGATPNSMTTTTTTTTTTTASDVFADPLESTMPYNNGSEGSTTTSSDKNKYLLTPVSVLVGHSRGINDVAWSSDAPMVATASDDKTLRLWDAQTADALVEFRGHDNFVFCCQMFHNLLVSGSFDETLKIWDVRNGECVSTLPVHSDPVTAVSFNRDGTCIVSASHDGLIRIWDLATGECLKTIYATGNPPVSHVTYSPNGKYILAGTLDSKLRLWNVSQRGSNKCTKTYENATHHVNHKYCIVSDFLTSRPDRQCIVTGSETGKIILYDINSRKVHQVLEGHKDAVLAVDAHDKMELIASGGMTLDKTVQFWAPQNVLGELGSAAGAGGSKRAKR